MSMLEQQAFQHLTSRWQRNCSFASSASMMGLTGLPANGESAIMSLNSASFISLPYLPGPGPSLQKTTYKRERVGYALLVGCCFFLLFLLVLLLVFFWVLF